MDNLPNNKYCHECSRKEITRDCCKKGHKNPFDHARENNIMCCEHGIDSDECLELVACYIDIEYRGFNGLYLCQGHSPIKKDYCYVFMKDKDNICFKNKEI